MVYFHHFLNKEIKYTKAEIHITTQHIKHTFNVQIYVCCNKFYFEHFTNLYNRLQIIIKHATC